MRHSIHLPSGKPRIATHHDQVPSSGARPEEGIESYLVQKDFLKCHKRVSVYMTHFKFKSKIPASSRFIRTAIVPLIKLAGKIHKVKVAREDKLDGS